MKTEILIEFKDEVTLRFTVNHFLNLKFVGPYLFITDRNGSTNSWEIEKVRKVTVTP